VSTLRFRWLALVGLVAGFAGWLVNWLATRNGFGTPTLPLTSLVTTAVIIGITLVFGRRVLRWRNGDHDRPLDPILATRTLVLAQACAYAGALSLGWHAGIFVDQVALLSIRSTTAPLWGAAALMAGGIIMIMVGLVVEDFCRLPPDDDGSGAAGSSEGEYA
jgi:drug/metabolite transporter (DMT)-like permease